MTLKSKFVYIIAIVSLMVMLIGTSTTGAFTQIERALNFASIGLVKGQTLMIHFTNNGSEPLTINFQVLDDLGKNHLPLTQMEVYPGRTVHAALSADAISFEGRAQVRGKVQVSGDRSINFFGSAEVINNDTQKTEIFLPAVQ